MLKYDSVHGRFKGDIAVEGNTLVVNGKKIRLTAVKDPAELKWGELGADVVVESTGLFLTQDDRAEAHRGRREESDHVGAVEGRHADVRLRREPQDATPGRTIISNASCTTNCLAPIAKVLHDTLGHQARPDDHGARDDRDAEDRRRSSNKDWRGGRGILENIIPSSTGAAKAVGKVIPELNKKLTGMSFRVPTSDVSVVDLTVELIKEATYEQICAAMKAASEGRDEGRARLHRGQGRRDRFPRRQSAPRSSTPKPASRSTAPSSRSSSWYDNEWGYSSKVLEMARVISK